MKKLWYLLLLPLLMGLAACGDDDEEENNGGGGDTSNIVGLWELSNIKGTFTAEGISFPFDVSPQDNPEAFEEVDVADYVRYDFKSDGTFVGYEYEHGEWKQYTNNARYTVNGNVLTLTNGVETEKYNIVSISSSKMILHFEESEEGFKVVMDVTFKKIK